MYGHIFKLQCDTNKTVSVSEINSTPYQKTAWSQSADMDMDTFRKYAFKRTIACLGNRGGTELFFAVRPARAKNPYATFVHMSVSYPQRRKWKID